MAFNDVFLCLRLSNLGGLNTGLGVSGLSIVVGTEYESHHLNNTEQFNDRSLARWMSVDTKHVIKINVPLYNGGNEYSVELINNVNGTRFLHRIIWYMVYYMVCLNGVERLFVMI